MEMKKIKTLLLVYLFTLLYYTESAKILVIFTIPARSHYILGSSLAKGLAERGHDVTMVSPFKEKVPPKNGTYRDVTLTGMYEEWQKKMDTEMNMFEREETHPLIRTTFMLPMMHNISITPFEHENFKKLLASKEKFDVIILEQFLNDAMKGFARAS